MAIKMDPPSKEAKEAAAELERIYRTRLSALAKERGLELDPEKLSQAASLVAGEAIERHEAEVAESIARSVLEDDPEAAALIVPTEPPE